MVEVRNTTPASRIRQSTPSAKKSQLNAASTCDQTNSTRSPPNVVPEIPPSRSGRGEGRKTIIWTARRAPDISTL